MVLEYAYTAVLAAASQQHRGPHAAGTYNLSSYGFRANAYIWTQRCCEKAP